MEDPSRAWPVEGVQQLCAGMKSKCCSCCESAHQLDSSPALVFCVKRDFEVLKIGDSNYFSLLWVFLG